MEKYIGCCDLSTVFSSADPCAFGDLCLKSLVNCETATLIEIARVVTTRNDLLTSQKNRIVGDIITKCLLHLKSLQPDLRTLSRLCDSLVAVCDKVVSNGGKDLLQTVVTDLKEIVEEKRAILSSATLPQDHTQNVTVLLHLSRTLVLLVKNSDENLGVAKYVTGVIMQVLDEHNPVSTSFVMVHIVPLLSDGEILKEIWFVAQTLLEETPADGFATDLMYSGFIMTCSLCELCLVPDSLFSLETEPTFWQVVQHGVTSPSAPIRKRAMYVLKRAVEYCAKNSKTLCCDEQEEVIFYWDSKETNELNAMWEDIIILLEVLEEKQIHVLKPVLSKVDRLIHVVTSGNSNPLFGWCSSWLFCVFTRMLAHETKFIIRWAISSVLMLRFQDTTHFSKFLTKFLGSSFLTALNDASVYQRAESGPSQMLLPMGNNLSAFLSRIIEMLADAGSFVRTIVHRICEGADAWSGVALFHLTQALSLLPSKKCLGKQSLKELGEMMRTSLRSQEPILRGAIQCCVLRLVLNLADPMIVTLDDLSHLFSVLKRSECMQRGTLQWTETAQWLHNQYKDNTSHVTNFYVSAMERLFQVQDDLCSPGAELGNVAECQRIGCTLALLDEAGLVEQQEWEKQLREPIHWLLSAYCRPYMSMGRVQNILDICQQVLIKKKTRNGCLGEHDGVSGTIMKLISPGATDFLQWLLHCCQNAKNLEQMNRYAGALTVFLEDPNFSSFKMTLINSAVAFCQNILKKGNEFRIPESLNAWHLLGLSWQLGLEMEEGQSKHLLTSCTFNFICEGMLEELIVKPKSMCENPGGKRLSSSAMKEAWYCVSQCLCQPSVTLLPNEGNSLALLAIDSFQTASHSAAVNIFKGLRELLKVVNERSIVEDLLHIGWQTCMEMRHNDMFQPTLKAFIEAFFQPWLMSSHKELLTEMFQTLHALGETCLVVVPILVRHCLQVWTKDERYLCALDFAPALCNTLTFGPVHRKDQRVLNDTAIYIMALGDSLSVNARIEIDVNPDATSRALCVAFLCTLCPDCDEHLMLASRLADLLVEKDGEISVTCSRHFGNSLIHRVKNRCWQALLILQPLLTKEKCIWLLGRVYNSMAEECQQPSVRALQELLAARILLQWPDLQADLISEMEKFSECRLSCVGSFLAVLVLLTSSSKIKEQDEELLGSWLQGILPWCMAQHFNTRLYARTAWLCVYNRAQKLLLVPLVSHFQAVYNCLHSQKECKFLSPKSAKTMVDNFYYTKFRADDHYSLQTIFYELLRLTQTSQDEWIEPSVFKNCFKILGIQGTLLPLLNEDHSLESYSPANCLLNSAESSSEQEGSNHFQKKITPWTQMEITSPSSNVSEQSQVKQGGLVVVASLIDKTPNLGGLCRTCEVFGASEYVIGSLKYVQDKQFQSLSVTAEKWISIKEVRPNMLKPYLLEMKFQGYTLIGVEQTTHSKDITEFTFPKDTLLLLGNEREGLPVDLIQLLDTCVEIPQQGVVRSLNVHVSGALLIWEYTKQHSKQGHTSVLGET